MKSVTYLEPTIRLTTTVVDGRLMFKVIRQGADAQASNISATGGNWNEALANLEDLLILESQAGQRPPTS